jgi:putative ABC transport system permease protein
MPINIIEGRLPINESEIIIPSNYAILYSKVINDSLSLNIGNRMTISNKEEMSQNSSYLGKDNEHIVSNVTKEYTIVGICDTISFIEYNFSPGYSLLTYNETNTYTRAYIKLKNFIEAYTFESNNIIPNSDLLEILGYGKGESVGKIFNYLIVFLIIIIFIISFILIYNSYMLTLNERIKDYSLLNSIGTTNKQLLLVIIFENLIIGLVLIPLGILISALFLRLSLNNITSIITNASYDDIVFKLNFQFGLISGVFALSLLMIIISSIIPFLLSLKKTTISNLRQNEIIKIKTKKKNKETSKIRNLELDFINKNFKRYKNKYKFTIISIIISITLFISMDVFCSYAMMQLNDESDISYDIYCNSNTYVLNYCLLNVYEPLSQLEGIDNSWWAIQDTLGSYEIEVDKLSSKANEIFSDDDSIPLTYIILEDSIYDKLLSNMGKERNEYNNINNLKAPAIANYVDYFSDENESFDIFKDNEVNIDIEKNFYNNTKIDSIGLDIIKTKLPKELECYNQDLGISVFLSRDIMDHCFYLTSTSIKLLFTCNNHKSVYNEMVKLQELNGWEVSIDDYAESFDKQINTFNIIDIFSKVFIIVVIVISILNIFNTIFSSIIMRRKEFAVLTSIGMLDKPIKRIIVLENIFISIISIIISLILTLIISFILKLGLEFDEFIYPISKIMLLFMIYLISIILACMIALRSNNKANIIDALKKDFI